MRPSATPPRRRAKRFTANVSHELRTPLTTISGYAELIQSGMTEPKDIPVFARKIYNESRRLLKLIEDIMHLSKLDEGFAAGCLRRGGPAGGRPDSGRGKCRSRGGSQRDRAPDGRERFSSMPTRRCLMKCCATSSKTASNTTA